MEEPVESSNEGTTVEVIRDELRQVVVEERKYHRETALNKNRSALGEIQEKRSWDSSVVVAKARALKKKALPIDDYLGLQSALIQNEENINSFLKVDNVLVALARDLSGTNPAVQLAAANCCCNIALANSKACAALAKTAGPYLVAELDTLNYPLVEVCVWTIGNLSSGSDIAFEALYAQGSLKRLQSLLWDCEPSILPAVIYAVKHCLYGGYNVITDTEIKELTRAAIRRIRPNESDSLWLLALLSSREECTAILSCILPAVFDNLCAMVDAEVLNATQATAAIRLLGNTAGDSTGVVADAIFRYSNEKLATLFEKLLSYPQLHIRKETLWLIGNLYCHASPKISQRTASLIPMLSSLKRATKS